jgi:flagellar biosynthesis protein FlhG
MGPPNTRVCVGAGALIDKIAVSDDAIAPESEAPRVDASPHAAPGAEPVPASGASPRHAGPQLARTGSRPRRTLAVAGSKGGAGKSVIACNLAIYLSTLGRSTLVVDFDRSGPHLHTLLGVAPRLPAPRVGGDTDELPTVQPTPLPSLHLLASGPGDGEPDRAGRSRDELLRLVDTIDCDYLVLDLGAGNDGELLDAYLRADLALYVTVPEPPAVEGTYRFVRALFVRALRNAAEGPDRTALMRIADELGGQPVPRELVEALEAEGHPLAARARSLLFEQQLHFLVNQTRVRADLELGDSICSAAWQRLGAQLHYLGYIDYDDNVWASVRERTPLLVKSPGTKASKNLEKLARRLLALDSGKGAQRTPRSVPRGSHHDLLEVERGATDEEVRRAYRRMREVYAPEALCCYGLYSEEELERVRVRLDEAFDVLLDPARRRPYELSVFPEVASEQLEEAPNEARERELPPAPVITPETEFDGSTLRAVRESQGLELKQISRRTKINLTYLEAVESDDFAALPALVYVRGFVAEMAKCLRLDPVHVAHTYVRRVKRSEAGERA